MSYCPSRFKTIRRRAIEVIVGTVGVGSDHPIRLQSMTTPDTRDIKATTAQAVALAEAGCEIVRVTAPNKEAARCLRDIRREFTSAGFGRIPLVADIHFLPVAAMEAVEHVEKVRINPGNYADKKRFTVREYSDPEYARELERLYEAFSPLVLRCRELGRSMRIGTNHGSLSDRIMNRYGDTPLGMVESALEFLRIARSHNFDQIILSMKASNPKVMIQAYRLLVERMAAEDMHFPLHLGVTEAGDGEDGRIKSSIGIGSLLLDGLGDTIRVSLTEDPVYEIPVARAIADKAMTLWETAFGRPGGSTTDAINPYEFNRRTARLIHLDGKTAIGADQPPRVITPAHPEDLTETDPWWNDPALNDNPVEGLLVPVTIPDDLDRITQHAPITPALVLDLPPDSNADWFHTPGRRLPPGSVLVRSFDKQDADVLHRFLALVREQEWTLAARIADDAWSDLLPVLQSDPGRRLILAAARDSAVEGHAVGVHRNLADRLHAAGLDAPIWIRNTVDAAIRHDPAFLSRLIEASILTGSLLCDGIGDVISFETEPDPVRATRAAYNLLQGAGSRISKTEFVACPSCGRTLFDLQSTTRRIREKTGHLKGVKIAIMGCIVNGPGEMADADFGYVGGAPGKINLYVGKQCVRYNIPAGEADERLIQLIKENGRWIDPEPAHSKASGRVVPAS